MFDSPVVVDQIIGLHLWTTNDSVINVSLCFYRGVPKGLMCVVPFEHQSLS
ncbi:MAG: hypothetical protein HON07_04280 [Planctomycetaceae bacterium]|nr:hypothetical protein [Planctomycetaceae bacterium]